MVIIYLNEFCEVDFNWDQLSIQVIGCCEDNKIFFMVRNIGDVLFIFIQLFVIVEDQVMFLNMFDGILILIFEEEFEFLNGGIMFNEMGLIYWVVVE